MKLVKAKEAMDEVFVGNFRRVALGKMDEAYQQQATELCRNLRLQVVRMVTARWCFVGVRNGLSCLR
ncbi:MAG: hypothetical protein N2116_00315 [Armatimonadetes bacterium]|nr:hypothetical protein [Armatimonadota bacterium]